MFKHISDLTRPFVQAAINQDYDFTAPAATKGDARLVMSDEKLNKSAFIGFYEASKDFKPSIPVAENVNLTPANTPKPPTR